MVELGHARPGRVRVRVDQARQDHLAAEVEDGRGGALRGEDFAVVADGDDFAVANGHRAATEKAGSTVTMCPLWTIKSGGASADSATAGARNSATRDHGANAITDVIRNSRLPANASVRPQVR